MKHLSIARVRWPQNVLKAVAPAMCATALLIWFLPDLPALAQKAAFPPTNQPDPGGPRPGQQPGATSRDLEGRPSAPQGAMQPGAMGQPQMGGPRPGGAGSIGPGTTPPRMQQAQPQIQPGAAGQSPMGGPGPARRPTQ